MPKKQIKKSTKIEKSTISENYTPVISPITGYEECPDCRNEELNGWSSHCKKCGMPIVY